MDNTSKLTVVVPALNEAHNLESFLPELVTCCSQNGWEIILVDDGSIDGTREFLNQFPHPGNLKILRHKLNRGYGAALKTGIAACQTEYLITIDADGQHAPDDIGKLLAAITENEADLVVGSRKGSSTRSSYRGIGKSMIRTLAKILMTVPIYDLNSGMKIYRTDLAKSYFHLAPDTMAFSDILTLIFLNNRHLVLEIPIQIRKRKHGESSIGLETAFHTVMEIINIMILFNPMKIFLPLSLLCLIVTAIWAIPLIIEGRGVSMGSMLGFILGILLFLLGLIAEQLSQIRRNQQR